MADFDDADPTAEDEFENEDEEMEDANEAEQDAEQDQEQDDDQGDDDDDQDDEGEGDDNEEDEDENDDQDDSRQPDSPSRRASQPAAAPSHDHRAPPNQQAPNVVLTAPSPKQHLQTTYYPPPRPVSLTAAAYDIVPTMAAPQSTSINAMTATPDMRFVFSGGSDGYVRMYNWVETANGKVPLTVAQKHPFVDSVMKGGSLVTYWENEEVYSGGGFRTPSRHDDESKWTSPVYSLAVQHQAIWLLSGLESGGINLQTCRHQAGSRISTLKEHTSAVSALALSRDETSVLSGSWDKTILDWDLNTGQSKRAFRGTGSQVSAVEVRPESSVPVPEVAADTLPEANGTFSSNNADPTRTNGTLPNGNIDFMDFGKGDDEDAAGSPDGSLFGENDHGSLFGEDNAGTGGAGAFGEGGNTFGEEDDELTRALANGLQEEDQERDADGEADTEMGGMGVGGPVQAPEQPNAQNEEASRSAGDGQAELQESAQANNVVGDQQTQSNGAAPMSNGLPHSDEPLTAPPTNETTTAPADLPQQSESTFLSAAIDGALRIWDRRQPLPIATLPTHGSTPPWCTGACWSPDGNFFYAGRRNNTVDEYSIHHLSTKRAEPNRSFKFQAGSGPVYALRAMPNGRHLVCASQDILRIYDLQHSTEGRGRSTVPFTIVPGHRGGVISSIFVDPSCRFMLSAAGNRGWEGGGTEVLLGYEIGVQDEAGVWHK